MKTNCYRLIQEIKEFDQIQVFNELLIQEPFIKQDRLCLIFENCF